MSQPKVCVLRAPGTNCDGETAHAFRMCGGDAERVHLFRLLEQPRLLADYQVLCVPGGFSYGDDIGAGVIFSRQLQGRLGDAIGEFLNSDKLVLGICNGFQVLLKSGILPGGPAGNVDSGRRMRSAVGSSGEKVGSHQPEKRPATAELPNVSNEQAPATLTWNENGKYTALWVRLAVTTARNVFLRGIEELELPIAHAEGKLVIRDAGILADWTRQDQIALRYQRKFGAPSEKPADAAGAGPGGDDSLLPYPHNPNGSVANIAGLGDPSGRVLGLMPHPERFLFATQHPQWTRKRLTGDGDGLRLFQNAVDYFTR